jgi:hypothetical protein
VKRAPETAAIAFTCVTLYFEQEKMMRTPHRFDQPPRTVHAPPTTCNFAIQLLNPSKAKQLYAAID